MSGKAKRTQPVIAGRVRSRAEITLIMNVDVILTVVVTVKHAAFE
jgi:hypothetical protein